MTEAIVFQEVSKRFMLHKGRSRSFQDLFLQPFTRRERVPEEPFWALRDVSFTVSPGETLGMVGENGAGKSTILKLISRILEPQTGSVKTSGRVASLLELGAGFHPDLTGRENVYLYGSILGVSRRQMRARFDEIVDFAEIHRFIDVPLKHYSSGMQVRLGFAVATSLDPDILLIDEVLAVGDEVFQKKCLHRISSFQYEGKTILFVSHALDTVKRLCTRALWLEDGYLVADGSSQEVVERYRARTWDREAERLAEEQDVAMDGATRAPAEPAATTKGLRQADPKSRWGTGEITISDVSLHDPDGQPRYLLQTGEPLTVKIKYRQHAAVPDPVVGIAIYRADGLWCYGTNTGIENTSMGSLPPEGEIAIEFPQLDLLEGDYTLDVAIHDEDGRAYDYFCSCASFAVRSSLKDDGVFRPAHRWYVNDALCHPVAATEEGTTPESS